MRTWVPECIYLFKKEEGCLPTFEELVEAVADMAPCSRRRAFARVRQAILTDEACVQWDELAHDFFLDHGANRFASIPIRSPIRGLIGEASA